MARVRKRRQKPESLGVEPVMPVAVNPAFFQPLNTSWVDHVESDENPRSDQELDPEPDPESDPSLATISVRPVVDGDIDRLWDWVRADDDRGQTFLGFQPATARELYGMFASRFSGSPDTAAWAIDEQGIHQGFVLFNPITPQPLSATVHLYLSVAVRGRFLKIVQQLLGLLDAQYPLLSLVVVTPDHARARLYRKVGFAMSYVLTRSPKG